MRQVSLRQQSGDQMWEARTLLAIGLGMLVMATACGSGAAVGSGSGSSTTPSINLTVGIAGAGDAVTAPEFGLALATGAFKKEGLNVSVISLQPQASLLTVALLTNQVQIIWSGISPYFLARSKGVDLSYFYMDGKFGSAGALFGGAKTKSASALKGLSGLRCGSGSPGTTTYATMHYYEKVLGFQCGSYVTVTGESTALGSLKAGSLDVVVNQVSWAQDAVSNGDGYMLANPADPKTYAQLFGGQPIVYSGYVATRSWLDQDAKAAKAFVAALDLGESYLASHSQQQVAQELSKIPNLAENMQQVQTLVATTVPFELPSKGAVSTTEWQAGLTFYGGLLAMDTSTATYSYGQFWDPNYT